MAKLSKADVIKVAKLAKLELTNKEIDNYLKQLSKVVDYVGELAEVNTSGVEATSQTTGLRNVYRVDEVSDGQVLSQDEATSGTDKIHNDYFLVDAILSEKSDK